MGLFDIGSPPFVFRFLSNGALAIHLIFLNNVLTVPQRGFMKAVVTNFGALGLFKASMGLFVCGWVFLI